MPVIRSIKFCDDTLQLRICVLLGNETKNKKFNKNESFFLIILFPEKYKSEPLLNMF